MAQQLMSASWYRVAELRPRLRSHFRIHRHTYRGGRWYVLQDRMSRRTHRFDARAYFVIGLMNGQRSMQSIWDAALERYGDEAPTQEEVIRLLGQLHLGDIVQCDATPDVNELLRRTHRIRQRTRLGRWLAPLAIKIPLLDPDRFLERWLAWYRPLFGPVGARPSDQKIRRQRIKQDRRRRSGGKHARNLYRNRHGPPRGIVHGGRGCRARRDQRR